MMMMMMNMMKGQAATGNEPGREGGDDDMLAVARLAVAADHDFPGWDEAPKQGVPGSADMGSSEQPWGRGLVHGVPPLHEPERSRYSTPPPRQSTDWAPSSP